MSKKERTPQANIAPFGLRMQPDLKEKIIQAADKNNRSVNAEIIQRLERTLDLDEERASLDAHYQHYISTQIDDDNELAAQYNSQLQSDKEAEMNLSQSRVQRIHHPDGATDAAEMFKTIFKMQSDLALENTMKELAKRGFAIDQFKDE